MRKWVSTALMKVVSYPCLLKNCGRESKWALYHEYEPACIPISLSGSIPNSNQICAVSEVHPLLMMLVKVIPCLWIRSKYGRLSWMPPTLNESIGDIDSAKTTITFTCLCSHISCRRISACLKHFNLQRNPCRHRR